MATPPTKTQVMKQLRAANDSGRTATLTLTRHGHKKVWDGGTGTWREQTDEERAERVSNAVHWSRAYAERARVAAIYVEAWAREQGWREGS